MKELLQKKKTLDTAENGSRGRIIQSKVYLYYTAMPSTKMCTYVADKELHMLSLKN